MHRIRINSLSREILMNRVTFFFLKNEKNSKAWVEQIELDSFCSDEKSACVHISDTCYAEEKKKNVVLTTQHDRWQWLVVLQKPKNVSRFLYQRCLFEIRWFSSIFSIVPFIQCNRIHLRNTRFANKVEIKMENEIPFSIHSKCSSAKKAIEYALFSFFYVKRFVHGFVALKSNLLIMFAHLHLFFFQWKNTQNIDVYLFSLKSSVVCVWFASSNLRYVVISKYEI